MYHNVWLFTVVTLLAAGGVPVNGAVFDKEMPPMDIAPFALPNCAPGELRFEEPRDINRVVVTFADKAPEKLELSWLHKTWPEARIERDQRGADNAMSMGWYPIDDWFNSSWRTADVNTRTLSENRVEITFKGLTAEFPEATDYDVTFRRTLGIRVNDGAEVSRMEAYTTSKAVETALRVELDAGTHTAGDTVRLSGYNAAVREVSAIAGTRVQGDTVRFDGEGHRSFGIRVRHLVPDRPGVSDGGLLTFETPSDTFTVSLDALRTEGPIWYAEQGVYVSLASGPTTFEQYRARAAAKKTFNREVTESREQSLGGALNGQPRPHPDAYNIGCARARQRFRIEPNGDIVLPKMNVDWVPLKDTPRFRNDGYARLFFGLEKCSNIGRYEDPLAVPVYHTRWRLGGVTVEQTSLAVPLLKPAGSTDLVGDDTIVALIRFRFRNDGDASAQAELPVSWSDSSGFSANRYAGGGHDGTDQNDDLVPNSKRDGLQITAGAGDERVITSNWHDSKPVRFALATSMSVRESPGGVLVSRELAPGESCDVVVKVPFIALETTEEMAALRSLNFDASYTAVRAFWLAQLAKGAQLKTGEPRLDAVYRSHLAHVLISDFSMPDEPYLVNTSVGTSIYPNYANESCMIVQELDERGLHEEARRRLSVWLKYQGTAGLRGNFTDHDGVFYGAGGYECGDTYDQHHGWVLWCLAEHYFLTRDEGWLKKAASQLVKGADWVFRQRKLTMASLPHSRGWERGFLPAGSLEDVSDYFYWLSTNAITWRGVNRVAMALEAIGHPDAARVRREADAYKADLVNGFELMRQHTPLVRLRDGRWVPNIPSRLYLRGRDTGWIREILEGSVYLLISGLYEPDSRQAGWILDDFQDNRYMNPLFGYPIHDAENAWYDRGGFSCQPTLLAGLMPHLDRDEVEAYLWMFFNAVAAVYREEVNALVEHPTPVLGFSNGAIVKTSDEANAIKWLRYMYVYAPEDTLYIGRALPREWLADGQQVYAKGVSTRFGEVSVDYQPSAGAITLTTDLSLTSTPKRIVARFRHPDKAPIKSVAVNGAPYTKFDAVKGDVDLTGLDGRLTVEARY